MLLRAVLVWLFLLAIAIVNGALRNFLLLPRMRAGTARAVSTVVLSLLVFAAGSAAVPWIAPRSIQDAWAIGTLWVSLTLAFEFLGGHFIFGEPWAALLGEYNLLAGRIWIMVLVVTFMTPVLGFLRQHP